MTSTKFMVLYPCPTNIDAFEKIYKEEHVPMAKERLPSNTKFVATKVLESLQETQRYYRIAEIHFPSLEALQVFVNSQAGQEAAAHAVKISSGGVPTFMIAQEEVFTF